MNNDRLKNSRTIENSSRLAPSKCKSIHNVLRGKESESTRPVVASGWILNERTRQEIEAKLSRRCEVDIEHPERVSLHSVLVLHFSFDLLG
jgi:hypothetical protein